MSTYNLNHKDRDRKKVINNPMFIFQIDRYFYLNIQIARKNGIIGRQMSLKDRYTDIDRLYRKATF